MTLAFNDVTRRSILLLNFPSISRDIYSMVEEIISFFLFFDRKLIVKNKFRVSLLEDIKHQLFYTEFI